MHLRWPAIRFAMLDCRPGDLPSARRQGENLARDQKQWPLRVASDRAQARRAQTQDQLPSAAGWVQALLKNRLSSLDMDRARFADGQMHAVWDVVDVNAHGD